MSESELNPRPTTACMRLLWPFLVAIVLLIVAVWTVGGKIVAEKLMKALILPCGAIWIVLFVGAYFTLRLGTRRAAVAWLAVWIAYSMAGNDLLGSVLLHWLDRDSVKIRPLEDAPYDVVIVLGGATFTAPNGQVQVSGQGDRIVLAARMYHGGKTKQLICTGQKIAQLSEAEGLSPGEQGALLLRDMGVPKDRILVAGGRNTYEEMHALASILPDDPKCRIGLLTSAWHLPRALRLARHSGLQVHPVPADFAVGYIRPTILSIVPNSNGFLKTSLFANETLARIVNR